MDWNNFFGTVPNQNYNYLPPNYRPPENVQTYSSGTGNWPYYPVNPESVADPAIIQQIVSATPRQTPHYNNVAPQGVGMTAGMPCVTYPMNSNVPNVYRPQDDAFFLASSSSLTAKAGDSNVPNVYRPQDDAFLLASSSSLTATAGEFVPRSWQPDSSGQLDTSQLPAPTGTKNWPPGEQALSQAERASNSDVRSQETAVNETGASKKLNQSTQMDSRDKDRNKPVAPFAAETRYFHSNRNPGSVRETGIRKQPRGPSLPPFSSDQNSRENHIEDSKTHEFHSNRTPSFARDSGPRKPMRGPSAPAFNSEQNGRENNVENSKNQDRQRLLAQAASFYTSQQRTEENRRGPRTFQDLGARFQKKGPRNPSSVQQEDSNLENSSSVANTGNEYGSKANTQPPARGQVTPRPNSNFAKGKKMYSAYSGAALTQREQLTQQLQEGALECLVCCELIRPHSPTWSCGNCFHILHLRCVRKWATSSRAEGGWRCPACQHVSEEVPREYRCFCGKMVDPEWNRQDVAHSCGEVCGRARGCVHRCTLLCHPGPCPPCEALVTRACGCGRTQRALTCSSADPPPCGAQCGRVLGCGEHGCSQTCHPGECGDCPRTVKQECWCGREQREAACSESARAAVRYSCASVCGRTLSCGQHQCPVPCHEGACGDCELSPARVTHCPCGQQPLQELRSSCLDPVPSCGKVCERAMSCGPPSCPHRCTAVCHEGLCPPCPRTTDVRCRCGHMDREIMCTELSTRADDARCEKRCSKKRACGKHKCNQACCIDIEHVCPLECKHMLGCGQHRCEELCHRGRCPPCWRASFEELYCECGASVILPPVACGTRRPVCSEPCSRQHLCEHPPLHTCHSDPRCPPCTVLVSRLCYGGHELRKAVPCHQTEFSCGRPCGRPMPCGRHRCTLPCHGGECLRPGQICAQPCMHPRPLCSHPCSAPCHEGDCPESPCKETVRVTCECGHRAIARPCCEQVREHQRVLTALLAARMQDSQAGHSVDLADLGNRPLNLKTLECNDECKIIERNRRLAIGLQIRNPDLSGKLQPRYSDFLRQWGKKDPHFVTMVHEKLTELVQLAKQSKQKSRSFSFSTMNRDKRHFIHEYCEHFGCESQAYDPEPNRNVVATAQRERAWLPSMSLMEVLQREAGQRRVPRPVTARAVDCKLREAPQAPPAQALTAQPARQASPVPAATQPAPPPDSQPPVEEVDYFECTS